MVICNNFLKYLTFLTANSRILSIIAPLDNLHKTKTTIKFLTNNFRAAELRLGDGRSGNGQEWSNTGAVINYDNFLL